MGTTYKNLSFALATQTEIGAALGERLKTQRLSQLLARAEVAGRASVSEGTLRNLAPKIARRITVKPQSTLDGTKRLRAKSRGTPVTEPNLADLRAARKVLAIPVRTTAGGHGWIHPHFQFDSSGSPYPEIAGVLEACGDADPLAICVWLSEPNPVLENHPPMHFMLTDRARIVHAAQRWRAETLSLGRVPPG